MGSARSGPAFGLALALAGMAGLNAPAANAQTALTDTEAASQSGLGGQLDLAPERAAIGAFQDKNQRLQNVGWALVRGNSEFCDNAIPAIGLQLQDTASYGRPDIAAAALGLTGAFAVEAAAHGSPAALSGAFERNREVALIAGQDPNTWQAKERQEWARLNRAHDLIDSRLKETGKVTLTFADGEAHTLSPVRVCASRFELAGNSKRAVADGSRVVIGDAFPAFAWDRDAVFAGAVAHELAHNLLGHRVWLDRNKRKQRQVRLTEREADRLMPWLIANAGYDPQAAVTFMTRWGKNHSKGFFRSRAYDGWDERAAAIAAELPQITALMEREGKADWSVHFRREIDPDLGLEASQETTKAR